MHWIVQENICQEQQWNSLIASLQKLNIQYSIHKVVPFSGDLIPEPVVSGYVLCYGSTAMGNVAKRMNWHPGVIELPNYRVQMNSPWQEYYLNNKPEYYFLWQLAEKKLHYKEYFIKPIDDSKFIPGQIMTSEEIFEWAKKVVILGENDGSNVNSDSMVIVSPPKSIKQEIRFWIVNDAVVTFSLYKMGRTIVYNRHTVDERISAFAHTLCSSTFSNYWKPAEAYCLDICIDGEDKLKIIEINNINSSGLYDCDTLKLVHALDNMKYD